MKRGNGFAALAIAQAVVLATAAAPVRAVAPGEWHIAVTSGNDDMVYLLPAYPAAGGFGLVVVDGTWH